PQRPRGGVALLRRFERRGNRGGYGNLARDGQARLENGEGVVVCRADWGARRRLNADFRAGPLLVAADKFGAQSAAGHAQQGNEHEQHQEHDEQDGGQSGSGFEHAQSFPNVGVGRVFQLLAEEGGDPAIGGHGYDRQGEDHGGNGKHDHPSDPAEADACADVEQDPGAPPVEEDGQEPGGDPEDQIERGDPTEQERHRSHDKGNPHGHQVVEIERGRLQLGGDGSGRGRGRGRDEFGYALRFGLRRNDVTLRFAAFVAEEGVGRQLSAAGAKIGHYAAPSVATGGPNARTSGSLGAGSEGNGRMVAYSLGRNQGPAATRGVRRDHARDGRHRGVGDLHEPECRGAAGAHPVPHPRGVGGGRGAGPAGGMPRGGTGDAAAGGRGTISLFARGVSSGRGVRLRLGAAAGDADRRDGGGGGDVRALLPRDQRGDVER